MANGWGNDKIRGLAELTGMRAQSTPSRESDAKTERAFGCSDEAKIQ